MSDERTILADGGWWEVGSIKSSPSPALTIQSARAGAFKFKLYISRTEAALIIVTARIGRRITHGKFVIQVFDTFEFEVFASCVLGAWVEGSKECHPKGLQLFRRRAGSFLIANKLPLE